MKLSWIKRYALYDRDSNLIDVSDRMQTDKCERCGGYITIEDTHEICYRSKAYMKEAKDSINWFKKLFKRRNKNDK